MISICFINDNIANSTSFTLFSCHLHAAAFHGYFLTASPPTMPTFLIGIALQCIEIIINFVTIFQNITAKHKLSVNKNKAALLHVNLSYQSIIVADEKYILI